MVDWFSLSIPVAYLGVLVGSLVTFSYLYRRRKAAKAASLAPWFPQHLQRNVYLSLLHHEQTNPETGKPIQIPDTVIKAALLRRAMEDINRIIQLRNAKQALSTLLQRGSVGDDLWQRFQRAEKELEAELEDVVHEANALAPNWGQHIFQSANEMAANARLRTRIEEIQAKAEPEREWWNKRREVLRVQFMKELDDEAAASGKGAKETPTNAAQPPPPTPAKTESTASSVVGSTGSEEDGVWVEEGGPTSPTSPQTASTPATPGAGGASGGGGGKKKKKKGKR